MSGFVYKWTNSSNGMMYIGSHRGDINDGYIGGGVYFSRAYKKNPELFSREILYVGDDFRQEEERILTELDCASNESYYNLKNSAIGGHTGYGEKWMESIRRVNSDPLVREARHKRMLGNKYSQKYDLDKVWLEIKDLYLQGLSYDEIKKATGYSRGTIYRAKQKAKKQNEQH